MLIATRLGSPTTSSSQPAPNKFPNSVPSPPFYDCMHSITSSSLLHIPGCTTVLPLTSPINHLNTSLHIDLSRETLLPPL